MIFVQFTVSTLTICVNLYILMGTQITFERIMQLAIYSSCMLTQIYIFCWYGNEVKLKVYFFHDNNESNPSIQSVTSYFFFFLSSSRAWIFLTWFSNLTGRISIIQLNVTCWWSWCVRRIPSKWLAFMWLPWISIHLWSLVRKRSIYFSTFCIRK